MAAERTASWIPVSVALKRLGVTRGRVYQLITAKRVRAKRLGGRVHVHARDVQLYCVYRREIVRIRQTVGLA